MTRTVSFDATAHAYTLDGRALLNVTRVLGHFDRTFEHVPAPMLEAARQRGRAVHHACALDDRGVLDEGTCSETVLAYLRGWRRFREDAAFAPQLIEQRLYHPQLDYAGTLDRGGRLSGKWAQIDLKTGLQPSRFEPLQTAAYSDAWEAGGGKPFEARYVVRVNPDLPLGYKLDPHRGALDRHQWRAMLSTFRFLTT